MIKSKSRPCLFVVLSLLALSTLNFPLSTARAQGTTAFTYQGQLRDGGTNANGAYTMTFKLYDAVSGGGQIGGTISNSPTLANGLFSVNLDFGAGAFNGSARWLDIAVAGDTLTPRVQVLPAPYAQFAAVAATVTNGAIKNAQLAASAIATTNIQNNAVTTTQIANGGVTNRNLTANAVNATNIASSQVVKSLNGLTDAVSLSAGNNVTLTTNGNALQIYGSAVPNGIQVFTASGTFTVPTNITRIMVEMWGGGGGGGGGVFFHQEDENNNTTNVAIYAGGGGGSGGYAVGLFNVTPGSNYTVIRGNGGTGGIGYFSTSPGAATAGAAGTSSSFGGLMVANGGGGGGGATMSANGTGGSAPAPATGSIFPGGSVGGGFAGLNFGPQFSSGATTLSVGGKGGDSFRGGNGGLGGPIGGRDFGGGDGSLGSGGGGGSGGFNGGGGASPGVIITY